MIKQGAGSDKSRDRILQIERVQQTLQHLPPRTSRKPNPCSAGRITANLKLWVQQIPLLFTPIMPARAVLV